MAVIDRKTKLKARRIVRRQKRKAEQASQIADSHVENLFIKRFSRLNNVRRFTILWTLLLLFMGFGALWQVRGMNRFYLTSAPANGGVYREGIIGAFTNSNPLFASSAVDASVSRLLYSGLFTISTSGEIVPDLATGYQIDERGLKYTVALKTDVKWHDGDEFNADDVIFTYRSIKNPEVKSPLRPNWQGVTVEKIDDYNVSFTLPSPLSSFAYELTNGIVPVHILGEVDPDELRSNDFNTVKPVGSGPFILSKLNIVAGDDINKRQEQLALSRNDDYYGKTVGLDSVLIRTYRDEVMMLRDFADQLIQSMVGLTSVSEELLEKESVKLITSPLTSSVNVFLNNTSPILSDVKVRQALVRATDTAAIKRKLGFTPISTDGPFLRNQFTYDPSKLQLSYDIENAKQLLDEAGWIVQETSGIRIKNGQELRLRFVSQSLTEYASITQDLQQSWKELGVEVDAILQPEEDIQSRAISEHDYDILLYGISIGFDPDVFAYWHSSQIDPATSSGLNLSEFKNDLADEALESGRTRTDVQLRKVKYQPFLTAWIEQAPAIALYQPRFVMVVQGSFEGYADGQLRSAVDRYGSIDQWKIRNEQVVK